MPPRSTRQYFTNSMRSSNISGNRELNFLLHISRILFFSFMKQDAYYYCLFIAESSGRKENELKSPRSFLMRITSHVLNWTFSFLYFVTKSNSNIFSFEMLALLSYSDFLFSPCPSFRRGSAEWQYFDPDHPILGSTATSKTTNCMQFLAITGGNSSPQRWERYY